jgi:hypothetical protein
MDLVARLRGCSDVNEGPDESDFALLLRSCSFLKASIKGVRVRMDVSSLYTPSVHRDRDTEKDLSSQHIGCIIVCLPIVHRRYRSLNIVFAYMSKVYVVF